MAKKNKANPSTPAAPKSAMTPGSSATSSTSSGAGVSPLIQVPGYFDRFEDFTPKEGAKFAEKFAALALQRGWSKKEKAKQRGDAIQEEFDAVYSRNTSKLATWQELCREVGIEDVPSSITKCKKALGSPNVMVNLVNLIDHRRCGTPLKTFASHAAFVRYTRKHTFPRERAKKDGFIHALLRHVF